MSPNNEKRLKSLCREAVQMCGCSGNYFTLDSLRLAALVEFHMPDESLDRATVAGWLKTRTFVKPVKGREGWEWELLGPAVQPERE